MPHDFLWFFQIGSRRSIPAKLADSSCIGKEHFQTIRENDELLSMKHNTLHIPCFSFCIRIRSLSYTHHHSELIQTRTEPLRKKRIFTWPERCYFYIFFFYILWIYLLIVINLIYCAKVLSNWRCQLIRIMVKRGWLQEWIFVPYVFLVTSKLFLPLFCAAVLFWVQSDSVFNRYFRTTCLTWLSLLLITEVPRRY